MVEQETSENIKSEASTAQKSESSDESPSSSSQKAWGYDMYPERKGLFKASLAKVVQMKQGREYYDKIKCEKNVYHCIKNSPLVKLMTNALRSSGWWDFS